MSKVKWSDVEKQLDYFDKPEPIELETFSQCSSAQSPRVTKGYKGLQRDTRGYKHRFTANVLHGIGFLR